MPGAHDHRPAAFEVLARSPVCPLGTVADLTSVEQDSGLAATRGSTEHLLISGIGLERLAGVPA